MKRTSALLSGAVLGIALLAACGGGGGTGSSLPGVPAPPGATATPAGSPQSFSASDAVAIPTAAPGAITVPVPLPSDPSGASGNVSLPANGNIPPDATIAATYSSSDASLPALARGRSLASLRGVRDSSPSSTTVIAYLRLLFSADVTLPQAPAFTFVVPGTLPTNGVSYWLAFIDPLRAAASWQKGFEGPATVTAAQTASGKPGTQLAFASNGQPLSFVANQSYYFAVYAVSATAATPTPVPSSVPSNPPPDTKPAPVLASPANVQFTSVTDPPVSVTFSQSGFTGGFSLHGDCTGIINTSGASPTWTLTPVGQGRCVVVGLGDHGATAVVHIGVVTPLETPRPTTAPTTAPSHSPEPTSAPTTAPSTEPSHSPKPTPTPGPSASPTPSPTTSHSPEPTPTPRPSATPSPTPTPGSNPNS